MHQSIPSVKAIHLLLKSLWLTILVLLTITANAQTISNISVRTTAGLPICATRNALVTFDVSGFSTPPSLSFIVSNSSGNFTNGTATLDIVSPLTFPLSGSVAAVITLPARTASSNYIVRITDGTSVTGTSSPVSISGTNASAPTASARFSNASASLTICSNPLNLIISNTLSASSNAFYQVFKVGDGEVGSPVAGNDGTISIGITTPGVYRAFVTNTVCAALISSAAGGGPEVTVASASDAQINSIINNPICTGQTSYSVSVDANNTDTYQWQFLNNSNVWTNYAANNSTSGHNTATVTLTNNQIVQGRQLRVLLSNSTCTSPVQLTSAVTSITVNANPTVSVVPSSTAVCQGTSVTFTATVNTTATGPTSYTWSTNETSSTITNTGLTPGTFPYSVSITDGNGCAATSSVVNLTVNGTPLTPTLITSSAANAQLTPTTFSACEGTSLTLTATCSVGTPRWDGPGIPGTPTTPTVSFSSTGAANGTVRSYSVVCTSSGCPASSPLSFSVTFYQPNTPTITPSATTVCSGASLTLSATTGGAGSPFSYSWSAGISAGASTTIQTSAVGTQIFSVTVASNRACTNTQSTSILVNALPDSPTLTASNTGTVCTNGGNGTITITASGCSANTLFVVSGPAQGVSLSNSLTLSAVGSYTVQALCESAAPASCSSTLSAPYYVSIVDNPTATIGGNLTICPGKSTTLTASGGSSFSWSTGETTAAITVSPISTTAYSVTVGSAGCVSSTSATVTVNPAVTVTISPTNSTVAAGQSVVLTASGAASFSWSTGETTAQVSVSSALASTNTYSVTGITNGCLATASAVVSFSTLCGSLTSISVSQSGYMCNGTGNVTIAGTASGATNYSLTGPQGTQTMPNSVFSVTQAGSYTVSASNAVGCVVSQTTSVAPTSLQPSITSLIVDGPLSQTHCGATLTAKATGNSFVVTGPNGYVFSAIYRKPGTYQVIALNAKLPGTYLLTTSIGGCQTTKPVVITGNTCP